MLARPRNDTHRRRGVWLAVLLLGTPTACSSDSPAAGVEAGVADSAQPEDASPDGGAEDAAPDGRLYLTTDVAAALPPAIRAGLGVVPVEAPLLQGIGRVELVDVTRRGSA